MKVLHFYKTYFPDSFGGVEQVIYQIARGAVKLGVDVEVLSLSRNAHAEPQVLDNHLVYRSRLDFQIASTGFSVASIKKFASLARNADVVHYHFPWPFMDVVHFVTQLKKPTVVTYHSDIVRQKFLLNTYRPLKKRFLGAVDRIVATSPNYFETSDVLSQYKDKVAVIPIGLDKSSYPDPSPEVLRKWQATVGSRFFLFVGMIRYYKGLHILLNAMQGVDLPVVIVGAGPIESELKQMACRLGLKNIHFLGPLPDADKIALLKLAYALVFPSHLRSEAFGVSLLEGAMFGKPMISSEIGTGTSYINLHGQTGIVVPPSNSDALRSAMQFLWNNEEAARKMGYEAERRYWELFTAQKMVDSYVALYEQLCFK